MKQCGFLPPTRPVRIVLDTDMATDCDDAGAMAVLHNLQRRGEAEILGVAVNNQGDYSAGAVSVINAFFDYPDILIGAYQGNHVGLPETPIFKQLALESAYGHRIRRRQEVPTAVELYRRLLENTEKVVIVSIGHLNNLFDLLNSPGGSELIKRSVAHLVVMGGKYPAGREHNFFARNSCDYSAETIERWPTPILFSGYELGEPVLTGQGLAALADSDPVRLAYALHGSKPLVNGRPSWDQTAVLAAVRGPDCHWDLSAPGRNRIAADGSNQWEETPGGTHAYLIERDTPAKVAQVIEGLMAERAPRQS